MDDLLQAIEDSGEYHSNGADDYDKDEPYETWKENNIRYVNVRDGSWEARFKFVDGEMVEMDDPVF